ncbi:MAG: OmpA family protein [Kiloniellales bacterium]|nr:OmpA family protein [Kiloniellales bacterium]
MAIKTKVLATSLCLSFLSSCAWIEIADVERAETTGSVFDRALYDGYLELAKKEYENADLIDEHRFANRARDAAAGTRFEPEAIGFRRLSAAQADELGPARARLMAALEAGAGENRPKDAARAQVMFDCWMEEAEEDDAGAADCRNGFMEAIQLAEAGPQEPMAEAMPSLPGPYFVMFDFDSTALDDKAAALVDKVIDVWGRAKAKRLVVRGHTDRAGSSAYNEALAERRAEAVAFALMDKGFPARDIAIRALGENEPVLATADGERAELNRRVEIVFER